MNGLDADVDPPSRLVEECREFLRRYYEDEIVAAIDDTKSITVDYGDLYIYDDVIANDLIDSPRKIIAALRGALHYMELPVNADDTNQRNLDVRVAGVDVEQPIVSKLRTDQHLSKYIGVRGQVSLASQVKPKLMTAMFRCERCSDENGDFTVGPVPQYGDDVVLPDECPDCGRPGPFTRMRDESEYADHQIVELTDPPGENPGSSGNVVPVHLYGDVTGDVKPGDRLRVNGLVDTEDMIFRGQQSESRREDWMILGHAIDSEETAFEDVEPERVEEIKEIANGGNVRELLVRSFAPDILTNDRGDTHKLALLLALFGGHGGHRDDINVMLIGAPGTAKSQLLDRAKTIAPKAVKASGKGATAAGLTATATKSETTGKWMLDAGALVLASGGVACIDEFDKMKSETRQSMHEAMEDQEVPINKAGINTTLTTETTVLAAANPKHGSFNRFEPLNEQINLGSPLLSRFDLIFGVMDNVDSNRDEMIARHQHERSAGEKEVQKPLEDSLLTEYIAYARQNIYPTYASDEPRDYLVEYYVEKRQASDGDDDEVTPVTARMNDALRRLAQASARMHLRDTITMKDAQIATELMDMTIGDTALEEDGTLNGAKQEGRNQTQEDRIKSVGDELRKADEPLTPAQVAERVGIDEGKAKDQLEQLSRQGEVMQPQTGCYRDV
jgi:replicative DNA helicase Mcm